MEQPAPHQNVSFPLPQMKPTPYFWNPLELIFDESTGEININYKQNQITRRDNFPSSMFLRRPRRIRTTFTTDQLFQLENHFLEDNYLNSDTLDEVSAKLALSTKQVKIWFKNRRRRKKILSNLQKRVPANIKTNGSTSSSDSNSSVSQSANEPKELQPASLNDSKETSIQLSAVPSSPVIQTTNVMEQYGDDVTYSPYYSNNNNLFHPTQYSDQTNRTLTNSCTTSDDPYYSPQAQPDDLQYYQHQQQCHTTHSREFQLQHKPQITSIKELPNYDFINSSYNIPTPTTLNTNSSMTQMTPNAQMYECLTTTNYHNFSCG